VSGAQAASRPRAAIAGLEVTDTYNDSASRARDDRDASAMWSGTPGDDDDTSGDDTTSDRYATAPAPAAPMTALSLTRQPIRALPPPPLHRKALQMP
jgi:hypothetical protein